MERTFNLGSFDYEETYLSKYIPVSHAFRVLFWILYSMRGEKQRDSFWKWISYVFIVFSTFFSSDIYNNIRRCCFVKCVYLRIDFSPVYDYILRQQSWKRFDRANWFLWNNSIASYVALHFAFYFIKLPRYLNFTFVCEPFELYFRCDYRFVQSVMFHSDRLVACLSQ